MWLNEATEPGLQPHESTRLCVFSKPAKSRRATAAPVLRQKFALNISICKCYTARFIINCAGSWTHVISSRHSCTSGMKSFHLNHFQAGQNVTWPISILCGERGGSYSLEASASLWTPAAAVWMLQWRRFYQNYNISSLIEEQGPVRKAFLYSRLALDSLVKHRGILCIKCSALHQ